MAFSMGEIMVEAVQRYSNSELRVLSRLEKVLKNPAA